MQAVLRSLVLKFLSLVRCLKNYTFSPGGNLLVIFIMATENGKVSKHEAVVTAEDLDGVVEYHVEKKFEGTDSDKLDMKILGRTQETRRIFSWITMLGFGSTLIVTWEALLSSMFAIISNGGTAGMFWGFLIVICGYLLVYASLAEMASMVSAHRLWYLSSTSKANVIRAYQAATSGGQYHWVSELAPPSVQRYLSYVTGWLCFTGWQSAITGLGMLVATIIQGLAILNNPDYAPTRWQGSLMVILTVAIGMVFNTFLARRLPLVEGALAILHFGGLFIVIIVLWTLAPRNNATDAFTKFNNDGGWSSDGLSMLVGLYPLTFSILGFDSQVHMCKYKPLNSRALAIYRADRSACGRMNS